MAKFDIDTLLGCFARMIEKDKHLVDQFYGYLQPETLFPSAASKEEEGLRKITRMILDHHKDNTWKTVSLQTMHSQIVNMPDGELRETCLNLIKRMQTDAVVLAKASDDGCLHLFMDFLKVVAIQNWAKGFSRDFQRGRINDAIRKMKDFVPQLDKINFSDYKTLDPDSLYETLKRRSQTTLDNFMKIGIPALDGETGAGWYEPGTLNIFSGPPGSGKSMMTVTIVRQALRQRKHVHVTCVEDREQTFENRLISALTGIPSYKIKTGFHTLTTAEDEKVKLAIKAIKEYVRVDYIYGHTVDFIQNEITNMNNQRRFAGLPEYEVDILDYTGHIAAMSPGDKMHEKYRYAYAARKNFALKTGKFVFDFMQINREGAKKSNGGSILYDSDFAGAFDVSQVCDTIITLNKPQDFPENNLYKFHVAKGREGGKGLTIEVPALFEYGRFDLENSRTVTLL